MNNEIDFMNEEFGISSQANKIDFKIILFKAMDYSRYLRSQDMGELDLIAAINDGLKNETKIVWLRNINVFVNSVKSFKNMLHNYIDDEFISKEKEILDFYEKGRVEIKKEYLLKFNKLNPNQSIKKEREMHWKLMLYSIENLPTTYDLILAELMALSLRAKYLTGNDLSGVKN